MVALSCQSKTDSSEKENNEPILEDFSIEGLEGLTLLIDTLRTGNPVDFDGDGVEEVFYEEENDRKDIYIDNEFGENVFWTSLSATGDISLLYDSNEDGRTDAQYNFTVENKTAIWQKDEDYDGYPEKRITFIYNSQKNIYEYKEEYDSAGDGKYDVVSEGTAPAFSETLSSFETKRAEKRTYTNLNFLEIINKNVCPDGTEKVFFGLPSIYICEGSAEGGCTSEESDRLKSAFACMFQRYSSCIRETNRITWYMFIAHMAFNGLTGGVGIQCASLGVPANSTMNFFIHDARIIFDRDMLLGQSKNDTCSLAIHEFMHVLGKSMMEGGGKEAHDQGTDAVYSCGRYCGFCSQYTKGSQKLNDHWIFESNYMECFRCADSPDRQKACGFKEEFIQKECHENYSVCHAGLGCLGAPCKNPKCGDSALAKSCHKNESDRKIFDQRTVNSWCCQECPITCNESNDMPCNDESNELQLKDTCSLPPPHCKHLYAPD